MDLHGIIESAEKQYKQILEGFFISSYNENSLSSHGIDHHRRVWNYSKDLLGLVPLSITNQTTRLITDLIIASYLHDIGMSVDSGVKHGKFSRELCSQFLRINNFHEKEYTDLLEAVENHDNKEYSGNIIQNDLLKILSIADDLDAFGITGVYRYSEIYLVRGIKFGHIGSMVLENSAKRFDNFIKTHGLNYEFIGKHRQRYEALTGFFNNYNEQLNSYSFGTSKPEGYCGVVELFDMMIKKKEGLKDLYGSLDEYMRDPIISWFFKELKIEIH